MKISKHPFILVTLTSLATVLATLLVFNFFGDSKHVLLAPAHEYTTADPRFLRSMGGLLGPAMVGGNRVDTLINGDEIFPPMLEAIRSAQHSINFETYIYWSGEIGERFAAALTERARAGVPVHVLVDWVGSQKMQETYVQQMREAGIVIHKFRPPRWYDLSRLNNRTHRKLLIVDGRIGFTGGVGIAEEWTGNAQDADHWRDTHFRLQGPAVAEMQATFLDNWTRVTGEALDGDAYFPEPQNKGEQLAQVFQSSSEGGAQSMQLMYLLSIAAAEKSIDLAMAYFVPDKVTTQMLVAAMQRGVRLRILLPGRNIDSDVARGASRAKWEPLLAAGAQIYEYGPTMYHCKVLVVDSLFSSVGSTNFDPRSFSLNAEANLNVFDKGFATTQIAAFENDLQRAHRISLQQWRSRPWTEKLWENTAALIAEQL